MKQFFKMMFASALGVFLATILLSVFSVFALIGIAASFEKTTYTPKANTVYKITLEGTLNDQTEENPFATFMGEEEKVLSLKDLLYSIEQAKKQKEIKGIYLEAKNFAAGSASLEALRRALIDFKESEKFLVAYADNYTQGCYYLCSVADKVFMNPQGILDIHGMALQTMFYTGLLDKLGIKMEIFKVGTYKGAVEPFMLEKLSDANRQQINSYISSIWENVTKGIAQSRNIGEERINLYANEGLMFGLPQKSVDLGLVDELKYKSEAEEYVKELSGQIGPKLKVTGYDKIKTIPNLQKEKKDKIAVLYAEGEITQGENPSPFETTSTITEAIATELIKLKNDESVKAVVLRVNSPGGSAYTSEQIWKQVVELKKVKPVVVSMGDVAASGGYYISCAASKIIAEPNTLTGSIGIFGIFPNMTGLLDKIDLTSEVVKTNTYADFGDFTRPMTDGEKVLLQAYVERGYDTFITRCADGRNMTKEEINEIGQGRVWTGQQALEKKLVDKMGGIQTAIEEAAQLAEITDYSITTVSGSKDFFTSFMEKKLDEIKMSIVKSVLGADFNNFATMQKIRSTSGIQARLPYDIKPL